MSGHLAADRWLQVSSSWQTRRQIRLYRYARRWSRTTRAQALVLQRWDLRASLCLCRYDHAQDAYHTGGDPTRVVVRWSMTGVNSTSEPGDGSLRHLGLDSGLGGYEWVRYRSGKRPRLQTTISRPLAARFPLSRQDAAGPTSC